MCLPFLGMSNPVPSHLPELRGSGHSIVSRDPIVTETGSISVDIGETLRLVDEAFGPETQALCWTRDDLSFLVQDFLFRPL